MNCRRAFLLLSFALFISGCRQTISQRLENTNSDIAREQIVSIELPSGANGSSFVFLESEVEAFRLHCDKFSPFDLNIDAINQHRVCYNSKIRIEFGDGMIWNVSFGSTYTEPTGALLVLEVEDGGFQGVDQFYTAIENCLEPKRLAKLLDHLEKLAENDPRNLGKEKRSATNGTSE